MSQPTMEEIEVAFAANHAAESDRIAERRLEVTERERGCDQREEECAKREARCEQLQATLNQSIASYQDAVENLERDFSVAEDKRKGEHESAVAKVKKDAADVAAAIAEREAERVAECDALKSRCEKKEAELVAEFEAKKKRLEEETERMKEEAAKYRDAERSLTLARAELKES